MILLRGVKDVKKSKNFVKFSTYRKTRNVSHIVKPRNSIFFICKYYVNCFPLVTIDGIYLKHQLKGGILNLGTILTKSFGGQIDELSSIFKIFCNFMITNTAAICRMKSKDLFVVRNM